MIRKMTTHSTKRGTACAQINKSLPSFSSQETCNFDEAFDRRRRYFDGYMTGEENLRSLDGGSASASEVIRIVLADDHAIVRSGLRTLLESESDFEVVAEASDVEGARRHVRGHRPGVLVLDLNMQGGSSMQAIHELRAEAPATQIVVLTTQQESAVARKALGAGALGYVLEEAADNELVEAVRQAAAGEGYLNPKLGARIVAESSPAPSDNLSEREVDVLRLIALGHTNAEIAQQLYLSVRTVETHRAHIQRKLGLSTRAQLVRYALERGLVKMG